MKEVLRLLNDILALIQLHDAGTLPTKEVMSKIAQKVQLLQAIFKGENEE